MEYEGTKAICGVLKGNKKILTLGLGDRYVKTAEVKAIAELIKENKSITDLTLRSSDFESGENCGKIISEALKENSTLRSLRLNGK